MHWDFSTHCTCVGLALCVNSLGSCFERSASVAGTTVEAWALGMGMSSAVCCAGVPGMVGGMLRHMRSLRTMQRECAPDLGSLLFVNLLTSLPDMLTSRHAPLMMHVGLLQVKNMSGYNTWKGLVHSAAS